MLQHILPTSNITQILKCILSNLYFINLMSVVTLNWWLDFYYHHGVPVSSLGVHLTHECSGTNWDTRSSLVPQGSPIPVPPNLEQQQELQAQIPVLQRTATLIPLPKFAAPATPPKLLARTRLQTNIGTSTEGKQRQWVFSMDCDRNKSLLNLGEFHTWVITGFLTWDREFWTIPLVSATYIYNNNICFRRTHVQHSRAFNILFVLIATVIKHYILYHVVRWDCKNQW